MRFLFTLLLVSCLFPMNARAHEFWIAPEAFQIAPGDKVVASLRVGQNFNGSAQAFIPAHFQRFDLIHASGTRPVKSRIGDRPALNQPLDADGLWIVVHETQDLLLTYKEAHLFEEFATHKELTGTLESHKARGLPPTGFQEQYRRFAKALIAVGKGAGKDRVVGLRTEIVAQTNPYLESYNGQMSVKVLFEGQPRANALVEVFEKGPDGTVSVGTTHTNAAGLARFPTKPGRHYLVDAVKMLPLDGSEGPVWYSLWASLTFGTTK